MKSLFIRCSQETYDLAHALAKKESRSLNKQIIYMIHNMADEKNVAVEDKAEQEGKDIYSGSVTSETISIGVGLSGLAETKKQDSQD
jgi:hypothetical protein|tara:strand:- start:1941 stop:2201 length:261 start_codon:yes stop_codon:yes gene_type:complete